MTQADLENLRDNLATLEKEDAVEIPRITKAIDQLEGYSLKALKAILNEDNKKSQGDISQMKKNYENL